ncbi:HNH endonuclease [Lentzea sp. NBRC 102530]|uniref:HNH endonuclease n=1 Tax=Lentzea sp. NBRC 102530 TaxID=3032201 RepID=UPI0024A195E6|nr:HNH endonuclease [Lentzea sp. NBRC 102530]GLY55203.1 hypothetical protein Lesp01_88580 [Lentzea sp. NBRC 102530]
MPLRPCLGLPEQPCLELTTARRCLSCAAVVDRGRTQGKRERRPYTHAERQRRAAAVDAHVAEHGPWCPGWSVPAHESDDLTADHVDPVAAGGAEDGPLGVLCRTCNGRKGARR